MKIMTTFLFSSLFFISSGWQTNFEEAKKIAAEKNELILLNFSGSDWCGPCIRLRTEIFESAAFKDYANNHLVLVNADFPRLKKNQPNKEQIKLNEALADKYNPKGKFPLTLLLTAGGEVIKTYDGFPGIAPEEFVNDIKSLSNAAK